MRSSFSAVAGLIVALTVGCQTPGPALPGQQVPRSFSRQVVKTVSYDYLLYLPADYGPDHKTWPLVLFLHGAGERGSDLEKVKIHGPPKLVAQGRQFPFILVSPQCPADDWWDPEILNILLDEGIARYAVVQDRVYLTCLSMGGYGTWDLASRYPHCFAAIAPVCGGGIPYFVRTRLKHMPAWVFHGARDTVVPIAFSDYLIEALRKVNAPVRFTVYPDAEHDSWTRTYDNPELYDWLLSHKRQSS